MLGASSLRFPYAVQFVLLASFGLTGPGQTTANVRSKPQMAGEAFKNVTTSTLKGSLLHLSRRRPGLDQRRRCECGIGHVPQRDPRALVSRSERGPGLLARSSRASRPLGAFPRSSTIPITGTALESNFLSKFLLLVRRQGTLPVIFERPKDR